MNGQALLGLTVVFALLMLMIQRAEPKRRRVTALLVLVGAELVRRYMVYRGWAAEGTLALALALILNAVFWVLIGRSNPPHSSDEIEVLGNE